ncbi:penicillin-binding protein 2 [Candidatus Nomurabacteria bacterium]|nr:penicillin-binding protein 2 [Candidatus Nomurabacteria bacterium]
MSGINPTWRVRLLSLFVVCLTVLLVVRLFFLQIIQNSYYADKADRQYQRPQNSLPNRGTIFFKQQDGGLVSGATMRDGFLVAINPSKLKDAEVVYQKLTELFPIERESFFKKAGKTTDPYEEIATRLDESTAKKIQSLSWDGLGVYKTRWRFYPAGKTAAQVLGLVNYDGDGTYGLEKYYNAILSQKEEKTFVSFLAQVLSDFGGSVTGGDDKTEADLVLSLEPTVQNTLETELSGVREKWGAELAGGVVLDPATGAVIALGATPGFDPNAKQTTLEHLANPLVERTYELGSTFKPLTMAAALDAGVVTAKTVYDDKGTLELNGQTIGNYDRRARGVVPMQEVLNQSLNTGAVFAMQKLGRNRFRDYMINYGLTEKTGIDLPNEVIGLNNNLNSSRDIEYATVAFGQGITVTPIQMARALAVLGNGGKLVKPYIVSEVRHRNSKITTEIKPEITRQVIKPETSKEITRMLVEVVDSALVGGKYKMAQYRVAAKTGTAQQARVNGAGYDPDRFLHSFFGYFPASNPRFLVLFYLVNPRGARYASDTLTEPFMSLTKFLLNYYHVPPDR